MQGDKELTLKMWTKFAGIVSLAGLAFLPAVAPLAQAVRPPTQSDVSLNAAVGLDGYCKAGNWAPVRVTVENAGPDLDARIEIVFEGDAADDSVVAEHLLLPGASRKEFFTYIYASRTVRKPQARLVTGGDVLAEAELKAGCIGAENILFGVIADDPSVYDLLTGVRPLRGFVRIAELSVQDLPDRPQGWAAMDALVIAGVDTGPLTDLQRRSLQLWLNRGGTLMVIGGPNWQPAAAGLQDLLPLTVTSTQPVPDLDELGSLVPTGTVPEGRGLLAVGRLHRDSHVLAGQDDVPLLIERKMGFGKVIFLAADPALRPLNGWDGMQELYAQVLGSRPARPPWYTVAWDTSDTERAVSTLEQMNLPSSIYVCTWLALYVVVIGPVNYLVVRRARRRDLAWLTIPVVVLLFSGLLYAYGSLYRGTRPVLNRMALVQAWDGSETAEARAAVGLFSPRRTRYDVVAGDEFLWQPFAGEGDLQGGDGWLSLHEGDAALLPGVRTEVGGLRTLTTEGPVPALKIEHALILQVSDKDPVIEGSITNSSPYDLQDAMLFTLGGTQQLGTLAAGETRRIQLKLGVQSSTDFYDENASYLLGVSSSDPDADAAALRRLAWLEAVRPNDVYAPAPGNWGVFLLGWLDHAILPVSVQAVPYDSRDTTLYITMLSPVTRIQPGLIKVTPSLFAWEASDPSVSPYQRQELPPGGYTLRLRPAFPLRFSAVESLTLQLTEPQYSSGQAVVGASLWEFQTSRWQKLEIAGWGRTEVPNPAAFVGPGGEVRLRIDSTTSDWLAIEESSVTLVVLP